MSTGAGQAAEWPLFAMGDSNVGFTTGPSSTPSLQATNQSMLLVVM